MGKDQHNSLRSGLIAATVLLGSLVCAKVAQSVIEPRRVEQLVATAAAQDNRDPNSAQAWLASAKEVVEALKEKNLFVKTPPRQHPVQQVDGILGREILVGDKWYKAGEKIGDALVISVDSTHAIIEWDGQKKTFAPIAAASDAAASEPKQAAAKPEEVKAEAPKGAAEAKAVTVTVTETVAEEDPLAWLGIDLSPAAHAKFLELWNSWPDEQKQRVKDQWNGMSDEEKQQAVSSFERQMEAAQ